LNKVFILVFLINLMLSHCSHLDYSS